MRFERIGPTAVLAAILALAACGGERLEGERIPLGGGNAAALPAAGSVTGATAAPATSAGGAALPVVTVYKSPTCGCCTNWEEHLRAHGFVVESRPVEDVAAVKARLGVPSALGSCHTAVVDGYIVEGHVPADLIARLLEERPEVRGLAVPGMPMGSPGMEGPYSDPYDVLTFTADGRTQVYARR